MKNRILSFLLAIVMVFTMLPTYVLAEEETPCIGDPEEAAEIAKGLLDTAGAASEADGDSSEAEDTASGDGSTVAASENPAEQFPEEAVEEIAAFAVVEGNILTAENFPDSMLLRLLKEAYPSGLTASEAMAITELEAYLSGYGIQDLTGIGTFFPNLMVLDCSYNAIAELKLANMPYLTALDCSNNALTLLELEQMPALSALDCSYNALTLLELEQMPALAVSDCSYNAITELELANTPCLTTLDCSYNAIMGLKLTDMPCLTTLDCSYNALTALELVQLPGLVTLDCSNNALTAMDCGEPAAAETGEPAALTTLNCANNLLSELKLDGLSKLTELDCSGNKLAALEFSGLSALKTLNCSCNELAALQLDGLTALKTLHCEECRLTELSVGAATSLQALYCGRNPITALDLNGAYYLSTLDCSNCKLRELSLYTKIDEQSSSSSISYLNCDGNPLETLDVSIYNSLDSLSCRDCDLTSLSFRRSLNILNCSNNQLTTLDIPVGSFLSQLTCSNNLLTELDLTNCKTDFHTLDCSNNRIHTIQFGGTHQLTSFSGDQEQAEPLTALAAENGLIVDARGLSEVLFSDWELLDAVSLDGGFVGCTTGHSLRFQRTYSVSVSHSYVKPYTVIFEYPLEILTPAPSELLPYVLTTAGGADYTIPVVLPAEDDSILAKVDFLIDGVPAAGYLDADALAEGIVRPLKGASGQVRVSWFLEGSDNVDIGWKATAAFRLDILDERDPDTSVTGVSLKQAAQTIELFRSDYQKIEILVEFNKLLNQTTTLDTDRADASALPVTVRSAAFSDPAAAELFELVAVNDRTLRIIPTEAAIESALVSRAAIKGSYKTAVTLYLEGYDEPFTTGIMTLNVKQSKPAIKAKAVSLNSYGYGETLCSTAVAPAFTGGTVTNASPADCPDWLSYEYDSNNTLLLTYSGAACEKQSCAVILDCTVEGWRIPAAVKLKVKAAPVEPKLSFSKSSVSLTADSSDVVTVTGKVNSPLYEGYELQLLSITETINKQTVSYENGDRISVVWDPYSYAVAINALDADPDANHIYTLTWGFAGKTFSLRVKAAKAVQTKLNCKFSGKLKAVNNTYYQYAPITAVAVKPTLTGVNKINGVYPGVFRYAVLLLYLDGNNEVQYKDRTDHFKLSAMESSGVMYLEYTSDTFGRSVVFYLMLQYEYAPGRYAEWGDFVPVQRLERVVKKASVRVTGTIDPLRPDSCITVVPKFQNINHTDTIEMSYSFSREDEDGTWHYVEDAPFRIEEELVGVADFTAADLNGVGSAYTGTAVKAAHIYLTDPSAAAYRWFFYVSGSRDLWSVSVGTVYPKFRSGSVKVSADRNTEALYLKDRYDTSGAITLSYIDPSLSGIDHVELDADSQKWFRLIDLGNNRYALGWKDSVLPSGALALKAGKVKKVKLNVFMTGNITAKPNATVTIKVTAVSQPTG